MQYEKLDDPKLIYLQLMKYHHTHIVMKFSQPKHKPYDELEQLDFEEQPDKLETLDDD
jgi:hypothetical protein